jgi:hypothetical protein
MSTSWIASATTRRPALLRRSAVGLVAGSLLAGCVSGGPSGAAMTRSPGAGGTTHAESSPPPDWRNASYMLTCDGLAPGGLSVTLVNGVAQASAAGGGPLHYDHFDVRYEAEASGDIDGDGVPDAVVLLMCSPQPSNGSVEEVQVISPSRGRIGVLPSSTTLPEASVLAPLYDPAGLSVQRGDIVAGMKVYGPGDSHASGPSEHVTVRWHWDGRRFVRVQ